MKIKCLFLTVCSIFLLGSSVTAYAQPKTMSDGTVFDAEFYANTYPDVKAAFGNDEKALYNHYVKYGKAEGRKATATTSNATTKTDFDPVFYANTYPDVKAAFGNDEKALYNHYIKYGKAEGRLASAASTDTVSATPATEQANVVSVETKSNYFPTRGTVVYGTVTTLADGTKIAKTDIKDITTYDFDKKYLIPRTDYSTGLIDNDKNGIDDRDPYNSCGYTDLNYNCIADGAPCNTYYLDIDDSILKNLANYSPDEILSSATKDYVKESQLSGSKHLCNHSIVCTTWAFNCQACIEAWKAADLHWE